ncbi:hypothetical protein PFNF54_04108 [Plasmodium falciparum NF54]|uniref:Uncharacterized protein n=1 Tax=Plasmodium falciparum (isolate NF54) TaxID=5843 RepID=W7JPR9_PLAFO|nr:hypothetical protein PFNF54_04108 [Plasmodium falciparum NF54]
MNENNSKNVVVDKPIKNAEEEKKKVEDINSLYDILKNVSNNNDIFNNDDYILKELYPLIKNVIGDNKNICYHYNKSFMLKRWCLKILYTLINKIKDMNLFLDIFNMCSKLIIRENEMNCLSCIKIINVILEENKNNLNMFDVDTYINVICLSILKNFYKKIIYKNDKPEAERKSRINKA